MNVTAHWLAKRYVGVHETAGPKSTPLILAMLQLEDSWPADDAVPWCSAFVRYIAWQLDLPRSHSLAARSWLSVGRDITLEHAQPEYDVVVLERDGGGHVAFFDGLDGETVRLLGGNQHDAVNVSAFPRARVIGVRRLYEGA